MLQKALEAAKMLEKDRVNAQVLDLRALGRLIRRRLSTMQKTGRVLITREASGRMRSGRGGAFP